MNYKIIIKPVPKLDASLRIQSVDYMMYQEMKSLAASAKKEELGYGSIFSQDNDPKLPNPQILQ